MSSFMVLSHTQLSSNPEFMSLQRFISSSCIAMSRSFRCQPLYPLAGYRGYTVFYRTSNVPSSALWSEPAIVTASRSPTTTPRSCTMWSISTAAGTGITLNNFLFAE